LSAQETGCYIEHRLKVAGYSGGLLFAPDALSLIAAQSQGIPREINNICFKALSLGEASGCQMISDEIVEEVLANITVDSITLQSRARVSSAAATPVPTSPLFPDGPTFELAQEINDLIASRAYELFESSGFTHGGHAREDWLRAESEILLKVPVDVTETETELTVHADVPGFGEKDLEVRIAPRFLCILGRRQETSDQKEGKTVYSERRSKQIFRMLDLRSEIDPDGVQATVSDGLLEIKVSKVGLSEKVRVVVRAATA
jgi:HSP20 family protein